MATAPGGGVRKLRRSVWSAVKRCSELFCGVSCLSCSSRRARRRFTCGRQIYMHVYLCMCVCIYLCMCVSYVCISMYLSVCRSKYLFGYLSVYLSISPYTYLNTHTHTHTHTQQAGEAGKLTSSARVCKEPPYSARLKSKTASAMASCHIINKVK
jgi:hypothetical protein